MKQFVIEIEYDRHLIQAIDKNGHIDREVNTDLFSSVVHHIVGQQISSAAQKTVWARLTEKLGAIIAETVCSTSREEIQNCGITFKKADYIKDFSEKVQIGEFNIDALRDMPNEDVIKGLSALKGIGVWTAEMLLIFCLQRPDVVSYGDFGIQRGMRMLYHHKQIDREGFDKYARRFSPYGTVASLYLWAIAGGAIPEMRDYALLDKLKIKYEVVEHPAMFSAADNELHEQDINATIFKNLFLRNKDKSRYYLYSLPIMKRADLAALATQIGETRFSFGNENELWDKLRIRPGSVSPLNVIDAPRTDMEILIDREIFDCGRFGIHPNDNTATVILAPKDLMKILDAAGCRYRVIANIRTIQEFLSLNNPEEYDFKFQCNAYEHFPDDPIEFFNSYKYKDKGNQQYDCDKDSLTKAILCKLCGAEEKGGRYLSFHGKRVETDTINSFESRRIIIGDNSNPELIRFATLTHTIGNFNFGPENFGSFKGNYKEAKETNAWSEFDRFDIFCEKYIEIRQWFFDNKDALFMGMYFNSDGSPVSLESLTVVNRLILERGKLIIERLRELQN